MAGKTAVVTGGASGIGAAISRALAEEGANVVIADIDSAKAEEVVAEIVERGGVGSAAVVDVTDRAAVAAGIALAVKTYGRLDVYFNNAGMNYPTKFLETTVEDFEKIFRVNGISVFIGIQEAAKQYIAQGGGGKVVNTASVAGRTGFASFAPYSATKAAVISLTQAAARALAEHSITVNAFSPGVVATPLWEKLDRDLERIGEAASRFENLSGDILMGRPARPEDISPTALFLASSDSDYLTGQVMAIDGGMILV